MSDAKSLIIAEILMREKEPFRMSAIVKGTGLRSSHVDYHLKRLVDEGFLEKQGQVYLLVNQAGLIDSLISTKSNVAEPKFLNKYPFKEYRNTHLDGLLYGRAVDLPYHREIKTSMLEDIDNTIKQLKEVRRKIANDSIDPNTARRRLKDKKKQDKVVLGFNQLSDLFGYAIDKDLTLNTIDEFTWSDQ
jgi:DNA-binding transcriptional ArsR family regulator